MCHYPVWGGKQRTRATSSPRFALNSLPNQPLALKYRHWSGEENRPLSLSELALRSQKGGSKDILSPKGGCRGGVKGVGVQIRAPGVMLSILGVLERAR